MDMFKKYFDVKCVIGMWEQQQHSYFYMLFTIGMNSLGCLLNEHTWIVCEYG